MMTTAPQQFADSSHLQERRQHPRFLPKTLIYVACGEGNGGMVLNASDDGMAVSMAIPIGGEAFSALNVCMKGLPYAIESSGRVVWTTKSRKRAGIQLIDVSEAKREQIREWLAMEGIREINLAARPVESNVAAEDANITASVDHSTAPEASLESFGGSASETLGPAESSKAVEPGDDSNGRFPHTHPVPFRDNEWDLASVTMVPRKKPKPEGLSAFALTILWIAIPSFGIGILVGRRPLEQWLAGGDAVGKSISRSGTEARRGNPGSAPANANVSLPGTEAARQPDTSTIPGGSSGNEVAASLEQLDDLPTRQDAKLYNSMSTQEARALAHVSHIDMPSVTASTATPSAAIQRSASGELAKSQAPPSATSGRIVASTANTASPDVASKGAPANVPPGAAKSAPLPPNSNSSTAAKHESTPSNLSTGSNHDSLLPVAAEKSVANGSGNVASDVPSADVNSSGGTFDASKGASSTTPITPAVNSAPAPRRNLVAETRQIFSSIMKRSTTSSSAVPAAPSAVVVRPVASNVPAGAPAIQTQPPLRGTMLVARKNDQTYLLTLPMESVPGGNAASIRMQRFVMVPKQSRWHHRGAIAKVTVGELISMGSSDDADAGIKPRPGDSITVRASLDKNGSVQDLKPVSGRFAAMPRVIRGIRDWQFDQTLVDGKPVESEVNITFEFRR
jgi:hypothetical protein